MQSIDGIPFGVSANILQFNHSTNINLIYILAARYLTGQPNGMVSKPDPVLACVDLLF